MKNRDSIIIDERIIDSTIEKLEKFFKPNAYQIITKKININLASIIDYAKQWKSCCRKFDSLFNIINNINLPIAYDDPESEIELNFQSVASTHNLTHPETELLELSKYYIIIKKWANEIVALESVCKKDLNKCYYKFRNTFTKEEKEVNDWFDKELTKYYRQSLGMIQYKINFYDKQFQREEFQPAKEESTIKLIKRFKELSLGFIIRDVSRNNFGVADFQEYRKKCRKVKLKISQTKTLVNEKLDYILTKSENTKEKILENCKTIHSLCDDFDGILKRNMRVNELDKLNEILCQLTTNCEKVIILLQDEG